MSIQHTTAQRWTNPLAALAHKVHHAYEIRRRRHDFARLADLEPHVLDDIGLTYADIEYGLSLPLEENAALTVRNRRIAEGRTRP